MTSARRERSFIDSQPQITHYTNLPLTMAPPRRAWQIYDAPEFFRTLLPSFIASTVWPEEQQRHNGPPPRHQGLHSTSYLDGLRGIASVVVFICHYTEKRHNHLLPTYGHSQIQCTGSGDVSITHPPSFCQLPFIRVLYSGRPMVHIFFVISGLVLAYKPLRLLHSPERGLDACYAALASSVFRRPIRLFLPCAVSTLMVAILCQTGQLYAADITWTGQLSSWAHNYAGRIAWPWAWDRDLRPGYNIHLWTIPIEFAHAMLLFLVLLALSPLRTRLRLMLTVSLAGYCLACGRWAAFEFLAGLFLTEIHVLRAAETGRLEFSGKASRKSPSVHNAVRAALHSTTIAVCLFVFGWPNEGADRTPGIRTLVANTPSWFLSHGRDETGVEDWGEYLLEQKFWFAIAGVLFVWSCGELAAVRRQFERPVAQYFGRISYSVYLLHGPALDYWKDLADSLVRPIGMETAAQRTTTWLVGLIILGSLVVWLADLFWRFVDAPIVTLGHRVEQACLRETHGANKTGLCQESKYNRDEEDINVVVS